jgi:hypothetical protein
MVTACQRVIEALLFGYYLDEEIYLREGGTLKGYQIDSALKDNGAPVPVNLFGDLSFSWLSAVIFSSCATWSKLPRCLTIPILVAMKLRFGRGMSSSRIPISMRHRFPKAQTATL